MQRSSVPSRGGERGRETQAWDSEVTSSNTCNSWRYRTEEVKDIQACSWKVLDTSGPFHEERRKGKEEGTDPQEHQAGTWLCVEARDTRWVW